MQCLLHSPLPLHPFAVAPLLLLLVPRLVRSRVIVAALVAALLWPLLSAFPVAVATADVAAPAAVVAVVAGLAPAQAAYTTQLLAPLALLAFRCLGCGEKVAAAEATPDVAAVECTIVSLAAGMTLLMLRRWPILQGGPQAEHALTTTWST